MPLRAGVYTKTPLNTSEIPQANLDIAKKVRSNPLRWNGQFSPQLIQVLLSQYASPGTNLFDPFVGSGTVLFEAGRVGLAACGTEINPAAVALAQIYCFINVPIERRRFHLNKVAGVLQREFPPVLPLFPNSKNQNAESIKVKLAELLSVTEERLQCQLLETLVVLLDFYKPDLSIDKVFTVWNKLKNLVIELPFSEKQILVFHADARKTPLPNSSVDLVVTSPPYINVFNYHQQYRASVESLNWDLLQVARSEIGSNRKHRGNRFLTVIQFCLDVAQSLNELVRVCRPDARLIFIVGRESMVRGTPFFNGEIVAEIGHRALGFDLILKQERVFRNRFGQDIFEDILHFSPPTSSTGNSFLEHARTIARDVLELAFAQAPDKVKEGIELAITKVDNVRPSPLFNFQETQRS